VKRNFDKEFQAIRDQVHVMGIQVERAIGHALAGLTQRHSESFKRVYDIEQSINQMHLDVDDRCLRLLALQSPVAANLRLVVGIIKINTDLERMGDLAVNLAHNGSRYIKEPALKPLQDLPIMAKEVQLMVRESLDSFLQGNVELARTVLSRDDEVDRHKNEIFRELVDKYMSVDGTTVNRALDLILIARNLERIADHATNIAEDTIFVVSGTDVRHGKRAIPPSGAPKELDK